ERQEHDQHEQSDERVQDPGPGATAEQFAEPEEGGMKQREPRQRREHEPEGDQPVIGALSGAVTRQGRAAFAIAHGRFSGGCAPERCEALRCGAAARACGVAASSRISISLIPTRSEWKRLVSVVTSIAAVTRGSHCSLRFTL